MSVVRGAVGHDVLDDPHRQRVVALAGARKNLSGQGRVLAIPGATADWTVDSVEVDGEVRRIKSSSILQRIRDAVDALGEEHASSARAGVWLARALRELGETEEAESLLAECRQIQRSLLPEGHPHLSEVDGSRDPGGGVSRLESVDEEPAGP